MRWLLFSNNFCLEGKECAREMLLHRPTLWGTVLREGSRVLRCWALPGAGTVDLQQYGRITTKLAPCMDLVLYRGEAFPSSFLTLWTILWNGYYLFQLKREEAEGWQNLDFFLSLYSLLIQNPDFVILRTALPPLWEWNSFFPDSESTPGRDQQEFAQGETARRR